MVWSVKAAIKRALVPVIYRYPPTGLQPERLAVYLKALLDRADDGNDVAEIGCNLGGTSILANKALRRSGWHGNYICYDTFSGFVHEQFEVDIARGTAADRFRMFSANSIHLVRRILDYHGCKDIRLVQGDITKISESKLSQRYSVVLLDIDLSEPTYEALKRFYPRLTDGGIIFVDDCPASYDWKARLGYERFVQEYGLPEEYDHGLGVVRK